MFGGLFDNSRCPIGLDLGSRCVRLLQLRRTGDGYAVIDAASQELPDDLPADSTQRNAALGSIVGDLVQRGSFHGRQVISCLPPQSLQFKNLRLPPMPPDALRDAVKWEASERLHLQDDGASLQFYDAGEVRQGEEIRQEVIVMVAPAKVVQEHLQILLAVDLQPVGIDAVPGALARCMAQRLSAADASDTQVILDVGYTCSKVLIARHGRVVFFKLIDIGGQKFDQVAAEHLKLPLADVTELRHRMRAVGGDTTPDASQPLFGAGRRETIERALFESLRPVIGELSRELSLCLRYYSVTFRGRRPESVLLVGGEACEPQLLKLLSEDGGVTVETVCPLRGMDCSGVESLAQGAAVHGEWAVAAGLSMRPLSTLSKRGAA